MAIKKQNKRSLEQSESVPAENGGENKKFQKPLKKAKLEKALPAENNVSSGKKGQKVEKAKSKIESVEQTKGKKEFPAPSAEVVAAKIQAKKLKNAAKLAKKNENRKEGRKEVGQYKPEKIKMNAEQLQLRIDAITSRPELTKTAKRKLVVLRKRLHIVQGTYVPKPQPISDGRTKSQKKHRRKSRRDAMRRERELIEKKIVSEEGSSGVVAAKPTTLSTKQKAIVAALQPAAKREKLAKGGKLQEQVKGKEAKKFVAKKEEPEESEDDDDDAEDEEDSNEEVDTSAASFMNTTAENSDEDDDEEEDDDDEGEEEEDEDEDGEEEPEVPAKKVKQEPGKKFKQETEKKPIVKKENVKDFKNGPAANGDSHEGKKKRFVLFVGNLSYESTQDDIKKHFLTKVGEILSVRVPTRPGTTSPRGFAYVEVTNNIDYEKGLSLHNTDLNGRRIKVEYTQGGSKSVGNRSNVVSKNKKLHAMRKQGMLAGSRKEGHNRNDRRQKAKQQGPA